MNIFEIKDEYISVMEMAEDPSADPQTVADTLEAIVADFRDKVDAYVRIDMQLGTDIDALNGIIQRAKAKVTALEANRGTLRRNLYQVMKETGNEKVKTPLYTAWIQKNPESVRFIEGKEIPERFLIPQPAKVDTAGILKALKAGETFDFAEKVQGEGVRFR